MKTLRFVQQFFIQCLLFTLSFFSCRFTFAEQTPAVNVDRSLSAAGPLTAGTLLQVLLSLVLIVALIVVVAWMIRRIQSGSLLGAWSTNMAPRQSMHVISTLSIGVRERLVLVEVEEVG